MDKLQHERDLLLEENRKLNMECSMYRAMTDTSSNAFLYYSFEDGKCRMMGNWERFFPVHIKSWSDVDKLYRLMREDCVPAIKTLFQLEKDKKIQGSREFCTCDGKMWGECEVSVVYDEKGSPREKVIRFRDITRYKRQNDELAYMSYYDPLTGIYNRNRFIVELMKWLEKAKKEKKVISVAFFNIVGFRKINDGLGIIAGDELLQQFGQYLNSLCEDEHSMCAHFNSDLYCMAIYEPYGRRSISCIFQKIQERTKKPFVLTDTQVFINVRAGVAEYPEAASNAMELIEHAEIVMFSTKFPHKKDIEYFDTPVIQQFMRDSEIERKLKIAVAKKAFILYYQPQYNMRTKELIGAEALIRWKDTDGRFISPAEFIPLAEKSSLILSIGRWVAETALATLVKWKKKHGKGIVMSINISSVQFMQEGFVHSLLDLFKKYEIDTNEVEIEITETVLIGDFERIVKKLELLYLYGVHVALDDFGTGYASLSYLKGLPVHTVKIDKSFVDTMLEDTSSGIIIESIINMVNRLGYKTIAEGVETEEQYHFLEEMGCENVQGYLTGKPMPGEEFEGLFQGIM